MNLIRTTNTFNFHYGLIGHDSPDKLANSLDGKKLQCDSELLMLFLENLQNTSYFTHNEKSTIKNNIDKLFLIICKLYLKHCCNNFLVNN